MICTRYKFIYIIEQKGVFLTDYNKDVIKLNFLEDLSATMGTLAHLYKLLYWSRPNGKGLIPENLLRFNCDIIVSECRNFNRVRKAANTSGDLEIIKDNVKLHQLLAALFLNQCHVIWELMMF